MWSKLQWYVIEIQLFFTTLDPLRISFNALLLSFLHLSIIPVQMVIPWKPHAFSCTYTDRSPPYIIDQAKSLIYQLQWRLIPACIYMCFLVCSWYFLFLLSLPLSVVRRIYFIRVYRVSDWVREWKREWVIGWESE